MHVIDKKDSEYDIRCYTKCLDQDTFQTFNAMMAIREDEQLDSLTIRADGTVIMERCVETTCSTVSDVVGILRDRSLSSVTIGQDGTLTWGDIRAEEAA